MAKQTPAPARRIANDASQPMPRQAASRQTPSRQTPTRRTPASTRAKTKENLPVRPFQMPFDAKNMRIIFAGIATIVIGYLVMYFSPTMSTMALTVSPIILLLGYCVIVPIGIMAGIRGKRKNVPITEPSTNGVATNGSAAHAA
ncbi:MAG: hypothetical protein ACHQNE_06620 [Candidatus Kapaibacterium sp.]